MYQVYTPQIIVGWLERCLKDHMSGRNRIVRLFYGDVDYPRFEEVHKRPADPGLDWMEEHDTIGLIGRSTGEQHIPLLIPVKNQGGGPGILDGCIVRMLVDREEVYRHPNYHNPMDKAVVTASDMEGYGGCVWIDGQVHSRHISQERAKEWISFMRGEIHVNPDGE